MFLPLLVALAFSILPQTIHAQNQLPIVLVAIAQCESGQQQFNDKGGVLTNRTHDYGYFQINKIHIKEAKSLGYDIMTEEGNIAFALYLYQREGTVPWNASKGCWGSQAPPGQRA